MDTNTVEHVAVQVRRRQVPHLHGQLMIFDRIKDGEVVQSAFTFDSLVSVLGRPKSTLEGRYSRARLHKWKVELVNGYGRPARGFPLHLLDEVISLLETPGAKIRSDANEDVIETLDSQRGLGALNCVMFDGARHYTIKALAEHFNYSETTIRKKLEVAHLMSRMRDLTPSKHGGRARRGFHERDLANVFLAVQNGVDFGQSMDAVMARAGVVTPEMRSAAKATSLAHLTPHSAMPATSLRAWDGDRRQPVAAVNDVNPVRRASDLDDITMDLMAQLNSMGALTPVDTTTSPQAEQPTPARIDDPEAQEALQNYLVGARSMLTSPDVEVDEGEWAALKDELMQTHGLSDVVATAEVQLIRRERERSVGGAA